MKRKFDMPQYTKSVPKNPADDDQTINAVCNLIIFQTQEGDRLVGVNVQPTQVILTFDESGS